MAVPVRKRFAAADGEGALSSALLNKGCHGRILFCCHTQGRVEMRLIPGALYLQRLPPDPDDLTIGCQKHLAPKIYTQRQRVKFHGPFEFLLALAILGFEVG